MLADAALMRQVKYFYQINKQFCFLLAIWQDYLFSHIVEQEYELPVILSASG